MSRSFPPAADTAPVGCSCSSCEPYMLSEPPHLSSHAKANLAIAAAIVATAIAFLIDPAGAAEALRSTVMP